jgi:1,4-alpha-glucan branching enzyme
LNSGVQKWVKDLNRLSAREPALHEMDFSPSGFEWMDPSDWNSSVISFLRRSGREADDILVVCNFTPVIRSSYPVPVPRGGVWRELLNSDGREYGGSGVGNLGQAKAARHTSSRTGYAAKLTLPPLGILLLKRVER